MGLEESDMKRILIFILTLVIFAGFALTSLSAPPPSSQIAINSEDELTKLRMIAEAGKDEFTFSGHRELRRHEEVVAFLELLDSLPIPHNEGMKFNGLTYYPDSNYQTFDILFMNQTGEGHTFRIFAGGDRGKSIFENSLNGEQLIEVYRGQDNGRQIIVYSPLSAWGSFPNAHGGYRFPMEIDGFFISAGYNPWDSGITDITPESIYGNMTVTTIRDLTWLDRNQPGDIYEEGFVTTANALEILRFVVGLPNDIEGRPQAMAAADVNGDGVIDTADALEILRFVVGLPSAIS
jgi:hypothetical protein